MDKSVDARQAKLLVLPLNFAYNGNKEYFRLNFLGEKGQK